MQVGFTVIRQKADLEVRMSLPENNDQSALVTHSRVGNSFALLIGQLYYRDDLFSELITLCPDDVLRACQGNDAALVLASYQYLGMASLERFEGDFALVLWDGETNQLIGLRDPLGGYPLFWIQQEGTVAFSTSIQPLCVMLPQRFLNEEYCAEFVMEQGPRDEGRGEHCVYVGIHRVLPGAMVIARADSERIERRTHWDWLKHLKDPGTSDVGEIAEQYRALLRTAVQERIRGCTLAQVSGGMDSTSIALLAREVICSGIGQAPLHTASLVYDRLPLLAGERPYIESALRQEQAIVAHRLSADDLLDFDSFISSPPHDEPCITLLGFTSMQPFVTLAAEIGALTILTGEGADEIHSCPPYYLADLLRHSHFRKVWQDVTKRAKVRNCSPWSILVPFGLSPIISTWVAGTKWAGILGKKYADWSIPPWIRPDFARRYALRSRAIEQARQNYQQCQQTHLSVPLHAIASRAGDRFQWSVAAPLGIAYAHPFFDLRLLAFGLGMQSRLLPEPETIKPVLAEAMRDILPDVIRCRQSNVGFNERYYLGLARNLHSLETLIRQAPLEGMIDKELLIQHLQEASFAAVPPRGLCHFNRMLSLLKWLSMQQEWLQVPENVTSTYHIQLEMTG